MTITGTGLANASVNFGSNGSEVVSDSDSQIVVLTFHYFQGFSAGTVDVTAVTPFGVSATSAADLFTYIAPPHIDTQDVVSGPVAGGTPVTFTGSDLSNATVDFGANPATIISDTDGELVVLSPEAAGDNPGTVSVTVMTAYGYSFENSNNFQFTYALPADVTAISPSFGPVAGGTAVTISGDNLSGATAVDFGGIPALSFSVNADGTMISAVSPGGAAATVDVTVVTLSGTTATSPADQFTYAAAPTVSGISPATGPTSGGTQITVTGTDLGGATQVDFDDDSGDDFLGTIVSNTSDQIVVTAPSTGFEGTFDVIVTTVGGTSAGSPADQFTYIGVPTVSSVSPPAGNTLGGDIVTIIGGSLDFATEVDFGQNAGTIIYDSPTEIQAVSPAGAAGTVDVTVIGPGGTSAVSTDDQFVYVGTPLAADDSYAVTQDTTLTVDAPGVLANDTDPQHRPLTAELLVGPTNGTLSLSSDGSFNYTPDSGYLGADSFIYQVDNGTFVSEPALVSITVSPRTMTWTGTSGDWTDPAWTGANLPYPDGTVNAIVDTSASLVRVTSPEAAYALEVSNGGQVAVGPGASLAVTTDTKVTAAGTLSVDPNGSFSTGGTLLVDSGGIVSGGTVDAAAYQLNDGTVSASLTGPGGLSKDTTGTVTVSGTNSYAGPTTVNSGMLIVEPGALPSGTSLVIGNGADRDAGADRPERKPVSERQLGNIRRRLNRGSHCRRTDVSSVHLGCLAGDGERR